MEKIIRHRDVKGRREYLVKWKGYGEFENSWVADMGHAKELVQAYERDLTLPRMTRSRRGSGVRV